MQMENKPTPFLKRVSDIEKSVNEVKQEIIALVEDLTIVSNKVDAIRKSLKR